MHVFLILFCALISFKIFAEPRTETINDVVVSSDKVSDIRHYRGMISKKVPRNIQSVRAAIINFDQKCNNHYKSKRKLTSDQLECNYHNDHLVESLIVRNLKTPANKEQDEIDRFVIARRVYNRGEYSHHDLIIEKQSKNTQSQKVITIVQKMIPESDVTNYIEKPVVESNTVFDQTRGTFVLTELSPTETQLDYEYYAETDHWILNKEISVSQVFSNITKSLNDLWLSIDQESEKVMRTVASGN